MYVIVLRAIYGMLQSALMFYEQFRKDLESYGFVFNPYDPCVANKDINDEQMTVTFHVDDLKVSHAKPKVIDEFIAWLDDKYGDEKIGRVKAVRGKVHDYLAMKLDYKNKGSVKINMR